MLVPIVHPAQYGSRSSTNRKADWLQLISFLYGIFFFLKKIMACDLSGTPKLFLLIFVSTLEFPKSSLSAILSVAFSTIARRLATSLLVKVKGILWRSEIHRMGEIYRMGMWNERWCCWSIRGERITGEGYYQGSRTIIGGHQIRNNFQLLILLGRLRSDLQKLAGDPKWV